MRGTSGPALVEHRELQVLGPEVVAPLRHAVRLVDREERDLRAVEELERARHQQALGRDVQEVELAARERALDVRRLARVERGVEEGRAHAELPQRRDLVLHQRDQRRHDDRAALAQQRRHLVAQALAGAGRHQHQRVAAGGDVRDDRLLRVAEGGVPEDARERGAGLRDQVVRDDAHAKAGASRNAHSSRWKWWTPVSRVGE
jgi:hypothetical protein